LQIIGLRGSSDEDVWTYASEHGLVLISKDEDLANMVLRAPTAGLIWVRIGNCRRAFLLGVFRQIWPRVVARLQSGDRFIEIR
jgi:predicted nuclease of predicted toxin-antitoxin system